MIWYRPANYLRRTHRIPGLVGTHTNGPTWYYVRAGEVRYQGPTRVAYRSSEYLTESDIPADLLIVSEVGSTSPADPDIRMDVGL